MARDTAGLPSHFDQGLTFTALEGGMFEESQRQSVTVQADADGVAIPRFLQISVKCRIS